MKKNRLLVSIGVLGLLLAWLPALADSGDLDPAFGGAGTVTTDFGLSADRGHAVAIQADGKIVVAGEASGDFALARYETGGSLDATFGGDGKVTTDVGDLAGGHCLAIQADGKIIVAGYATTGGSYDLALARYNAADGSLDDTFGSGGLLITDLGGSYDQGQAIAIQADGKIVVTGHSNRDGDHDVALVRYHGEDGTLDDAFGSGGLVITDLSGESDYGYALVIQSDGQIVIAGGSAGNFALARFNSADGSLDETFGGGGLVTTDFGGADQGRAVAIQGDQIVVAGHAAIGGDPGDFALARYNYDGSLDEAFGLDGLVLTDFAGGQDQGYAVAWQPNGKILVAGRANTGSENDFALASYDGYGSLDDDFGLGGRVTTDLGQADEAHAVAIRHDTILVVGQARLSTGDDFALARYLNDDVIVVDTTSDTNDGNTSSISALKANPGADGWISLREAILADNNTPGSNIINFNIPIPGIMTIEPRTALPILTSGGAIIDGYSQPGAAPATATTPATILIAIDGTRVAANNGLNIASANNLIRGLAINRFPFNGIAIGGGAAAGNTIAGNYIGLSIFGPTDPGNDYNGVYIALGAKNNTIGGDNPAARNVICDNNWSGVEIHGANTTGNVIAGNYLGLGPDGTRDCANTLHGVRVYGGAHHNTVGPGNVISGNTLDGVRIAGAGTNHNLVTGNLVGTQAQGTLPLGNLAYGIRVADGAQENIIGPGNLISGNTLTGVTIQGSTSANNTVAGNRIGTDASGTAALANGEAGVHVEGAPDNTIGPDNLVSGNTNAGVLIADADAAGNVVRGNHIGTDASGTASLGNGTDGVSLIGSTRNNSVGPDNVIAYNYGAGVLVVGALTSGNAITQNSIFANGALGIDLQAGANSGMLPPVIDAVAPGSVRISGTACAGCTVEVFASPDAGGQGQVYLGSDTAGGGGFELVVSALPFTYLTATATDSSDGTSEFSEVFEAMAAGYQIHLPLVARGFLP